MRTPSVRAQRPVTPAPDYIDPVVGWRSWLLVAVRGSFRLRSLYFPTLWPAGEPLAACCQRPPRRERRRPWRREAPHRVPDRRCQCGVYAGGTIECAVGYFDADPLRFVGPPRVIGQVAVWGDVIEHDRGWRGERAYPVSIYLPSYGISGRYRAHELARGLAAYGVPVRTVDCAGRAELLWSLRELHGTPLRRAS